MSRKGLRPGVLGDTTLSPEAIREAGQRAAEAGTRFLASKVVEAEVVDSQTF